MESNLNNQELNAELILETERELADVGPAARAQAFSEGSDGTTTLTPATTAETTISFSRYPLVPSTPPVAQKHDSSPEPASLRSKVEMPRPKTKVGDDPTTGGIPPKGESLTSRLEPDNPHGYAAPPPFFHNRTVPNWRAAKHAVHPDGKTITAADGVEMNPRVPTGSRVFPPRREPRPNQPSHDEESSYTHQPSPHAYPISGDAYIDTEQAQFAARRPLTMIMEGVNVDDDDEGARLEAVANYD
ncbi:hypothetical protein QBC44DRAFT_354953 [Cladorrhinum sp. PSN332]|nr:hypothetical protein QBC44DRAFT_354953 [Cladorrhinum sp. PSN332]